MMKACALALLITAVAAAPARRLEDGGGCSPCQTSTNCEKMEYCYEGACVPYLEQDDGSYDNIIVSGNDDAFFGWNDDGGVSPVKKATQKKAAKAAKTMNDDATIVVSAPDIGNATSAGDDQDTTHESTAPASSTCKGNSDCPRGACRPRRPSRRSSPSRSSRAASRSSWARPFQSGDRSAAATRRWRAKWRPSRAGRSARHAWAERRTAVCRSVFGGGRERAPTAGCRRALAGRYGARAR